MYKQDRHKMSVLQQKNVHKNVVYIHFYVHFFVAILQFFSYNKNIRRVGRDNMYRFALENMVSWKEKADRKPLIIRGARQVGKTWLMKEFGRRYFQNVAYINFDVNTRIKKVFDGDLDIERILLAVSAETGVSISPDHTLLIFDEVQEAPRALTSLKYFYENNPEYAIVAAGSLLGVALHQGTSFPVGKVEFLNLYPLCFREFLYALGDDGFCKILDSNDIEMITLFREKYMERLRQYYFVGGMPEVVLHFSGNKDFNEVRTLQKNLLGYYQQDFSKHAPANQIARLNQVWQVVPAQLAKENKKFIYGQIREGARAKDFELAIQWLADCGLIHKVMRIKKPEIPLAAYMDMPVFKIFLADIGLLCAMSDLPAQSVIDGNRIFTEFKGALTEQYVLQQMVSDNGLKPYYYSAENARTEVDFVIQREDRIIPIEVKAEENLRSRSLRTFCEKFKPGIAIRTSMSDYREQDWMTNVPLYMLPSYFHNN